MLGEALIDPHGIDGNGPGLGLLPLVTVFEAEKTVRHNRVTLSPELSGPWQALAGVTIEGYEIHHGQTTPHPAMERAGERALAVLPNGLGWQNRQGNVLGLYVHGLFEDPAALQALFAGPGLSQVPTLERIFDGLADFVERHFATLDDQFLNTLLQPAALPSPSDSLISHS